jgi:uncharacterized protein YlbG (UPF0298 family)
MYALRGLIQPGDAYTIKSVRYLREFGHIQYSSKGTLQLIETIFSNRPQVKSSL